MSPVSGRAVTFMPPNEKSAPQGIIPGETDTNTDHYQTTTATSLSNGNGHQSASPKADVRLFFDVLYGGGTGFCHVVYGEGWYRNDKGKLAHRYWSETRERHAYAYPDDTDAAVAKVLELSARGLDVYVSTSLMRTDASRGKTQTAGLWCLHADIDHTGLNLDTVAGLGWCAIASGTSGHYHLYIPLTESITEAPFRMLQNPLVELVGADAKKAGNDVLRPPGTYNFKPTLDGGDRVPVRWATLPTGRRHNPRTLAAQAGVDFDHPPPPSGGGAKTNGGAKTKKTGERANAEEFDLDKFPSVKAALNKDSSDRSADTYGVLAACYRAHLTFAQGCWGVYQSPRLSERLDDRGEDHEIDLLRCWLRVVEDQQREAANNGDGTADPGRVLHLVRASDVTDDIPDWAWEWDSVGRIQIAVLTLFAGRPGTGKSTAGRWFAARWSKGELSGLWLGKPQTVAYVASEESLKYVVKPGLRAADADMSRIVFPEIRFNNKAVPLIADTDEARLTEQFLAQGVKVIIVDPVMATIERKVDIYRNNELRAALAPWVNIAAQMNGIVIGIVHLTKGRNSDVVGAVNGSSAFGEVARCVFGFVKDPDNRKTRVMSQVKNSCGPEDLSLAYEIRGEDITTDSGRKGPMPLFVMGDESDISVEDILSSDGRNGMTDAMRQLLDFINGRDETAPDDLVKAQLAKDHKLASQKLSRLHSKGRVGHPGYGVYTPYPRRK